MTARAWRVRLWQPGVAGVDAASSLVLRTGKLATFGQFGALTLHVFAHGLAIGTALMVGPFLTRAIVRQARVRTYAVVIDVVLLAAAAGMFITSCTQ